MNSRKPVLVLLVGIGIAFHGCRIFDSYRYTELFLPPIPQPWSGERFIEAYRIEWPHGECRIDVSSRSVILELPAERYVPVLAYPEIGCGSVRLKPAGGFTSLSGTAGTAVELSFDLGPAAEVLYTCSRGSSSRPVSSSSPVKSFNVPRFAAEFRSRAGDDPWKVDLRRLEIALATGNFRADLIRPAEGYRVLLPPSVAPSGSWISGNPCVGDVESTEAEGLEIEVTPGEHWFFREGGKEWIHLTADGTEWRAVTSAGYGLSGRW
ncbi:MAG: hypothetical protein ACLFRY_08125 [Spirochaetia bacterium]